MGRRRLLSLAAGGVLLAVSLGAQPAVTPTPAAFEHFTLVSLGEGAYAAIAKPGDRASVGNAGFVIGSGAVLVVDSFATPEAAQELSAAIRRLTSDPVRWLVNTHYHLDHVGGDEVFRQQGAVLLAHENARARG